MTIQEYSNKIYNLRIEKISQFFDDTDLEKIVSKIFQDTNGTYFTIATLFNQSAELVILNSEIVQLFTDHLCLLFLSEKDAGNVCFANSAELRPEFRQNFTVIELLDYVYAFTHSSFYKESQKIAITSEAGIFWKLVQIGAILREDGI